jgi:Flp pilus assembly pilin Flp
MKRLAMPNSLIRLRRAGARLVRDKRGFAAVEFAMVVPLMLVMFFGTVEFTSGVAVKRKVSMLTQSLADLVSRYQSVNDTDIANFNAIADAMMSPYSSTPLQATISELYIDPSTGAARPMEQGRRAAGSQFDGRGASESDCQGLGDKCDNSRPVSDFHRRKLSLPAGRRLYHGEGGHHPE